MSIGSGIDSQLLIGEESAYGTAATTWTAVEYVSESLKRADENVEGSGKRPGKGPLKTNRWSKGRTGAEGEVDFEIVTKFPAFLWKHALGAIATTTPVGATTAREHKATLASLLGKSLSIQKGVPDVNGVVQPFTYLGGKVLTWEIGCDIDGVLEAKLGFDFQKEDTATALAVASYNAATDALDVPLTWAGGYVEIAGVAYDAKSISFKGTNGFKTDRYYQRGTNSKIKKEPIENERWKGEGSIVADFSGLTDYTRFASGTVASVLGRWTGPNVETGQPFMVEVKCAAVRFDGETPNADSDDVVEQSLPFTILDDGTGTPIYVTTRNGSTTP